MTAGLCPRPLEMPRGSRRRDRVAPMSAAKTIDIIGRSTTGSDDAVRQALDEARRTVRNITGVDVVSTGLRGEDLTEWRVPAPVVVLGGPAPTRPPRARRPPAPPRGAPGAAERGGWRRAPPPW